jgi:hypothetical protein
MQAFLLDGPRCSTVLADTEPHPGRRDHDFRIGRVRAHLVDVSIDIDGGLPGRTAVRRAWDAPNVNVGEQDSHVRGSSYRANPEWWSDALAVDDGRARKPCVSTRDDIEAAELSTLPFGLTRRTRASSVPM